MTVELNERVAKLLQMAGREIPEADTGSEEEARTAARKVAKLVRKNDLSVVDLKAYDESWKKRFEEARHKVDDVTDTLARTLANVRDLQVNLDIAKQETRKAQERESAAQGELARLKVQASKLVDPAPLRSALDAARKDASACAAFAEKAKKAEAQARQRVEDTNAVAENFMQRYDQAEQRLYRAEEELKACSSLVTNLAAKTPVKASAKSETPRIVVSSFPSSFPKPSPKLSQGHTIAVGVLAGGVLALAGGLVLRHVLAPQTFTPPPATPSRPKSSKPAPARIAGT